MQRFTLAVATLALATGAHAQDPLSATRVMILGDSHAEMMKGAVE